MATENQEGWKAWWRGTAGALLFVAAPGLALAAVNVTVRDLTDPVPPGGTLTYRVTISPPTASTTTTTLPSAPYCFNPPPDCVTGPATCSNPEPSCEGNPIQGFTCHNALNEGANCGVGNPLTPDASTCVPHASGTCNGGNNVGLACTAPDNTVTEECPGSTLVCVRAANEGAYCGTGNPPQPEPAFCLPNYHGVCSGGVNAGQSCTKTEDCPVATTTTTTTLPGGGGGGITIMLPIPAGTTFASADNGGTSDGSTITWTMPSLPACGVPGTPHCPFVLGSVTVDPATPVGTVITNHATATDADGTDTSGTIKTTVGTFKLQRLSLNYSRSLGRDRIRYGTLFTLGPGQSIDPTNEAAEFNLSTTADGTIFDLTLPAGQLYPSTTNTWKFRTADPFVRGILRLLGPSAYSLKFRGTYLTLPLITDGSQATMTLTFGDDVLTQSVVLVPRRGGASYSAVH